MGSNSNRSWTKEEKLGQYATKIANTRNTHSSNFQCTTGAEIRGMLGVEKGNAFIKAIKDAR